MARGSDKDFFLVTERCGKHKHAETRGSQLKKTETDGNANTFTTKESTLPNMFQNWQFSTRSSLH